MKNKNKKIASAILMQALAGYIEIDEIPDSIEINGVDVDTNNLSASVYSDMVQMLQEFNDCDVLDWYDLQKKWSKIIGVY